MIWLLLGMLVVTFIIYQIHEKKNYWTKRGVKQIKQNFILGDFTDLIFRRRYCGSFQFLRPIFVLRDPKLIKIIAIKDFDHFLNHRSFVGENLDPLWNNNLFVLRGEKWKKMRATLTPTFTSSKMKMLFPLIDECAQNLTSYFENMVNSSNVLEIDVKHNITRFTNDTIVSTAFGVKCDSLNDRNNEFLVKSSKLLNMSGFWSVMKFILIGSFPRFARLMGVTLFSKELGEFFTNVIKQTIQTREEKSLYRPDIINFLMEAKKQKDRHDGNHELDTGFINKELKIQRKREVSKSEITYKDITSQAMLFYVAGLAMVSELICFMCHELALHSDIQDKLRGEVDQTRKGCNGNFTYESIENMNYMDMVISETLRFWPPGLVTDRECVKSYVVEPENSHEKPIYLEKGAVVWFPIVGIHRDKKYYPNPDIFDPERFSDVNKDKIDPNTYMPFGVGPRSCIGLRFALLETKILFCRLLSKFSLVTTDKTHVELKLSMATISLQPENGFWVGLKARS